MRILAIDPGVNGAVAVLEDGRFLSVDDTPTFEIAGPKKKRQEYDIPAMTNLLLGRGMIDLAVIEQIQTIVHAGTVQNFRLGYGFGIWCGLLSMSGIPLERVTPQRWKKAIMGGLPKEKSASILRARELYPRAPITLAKHDGRADALLLATYAHRHLSPPPPLQDIA